ncbi:MAG: cysteine--1-D-myo-inosityl 2-amino-2-deoxy-alpha-D-glucopyranoside ligase [Actinobacteria bacterium]|nr:cysteine--1-D-myo-inosityl 2-amino-2-deoxy-alpha-D-glucopyranoside ligase [Actinomycetota bacterium]
MYAWRGTDVPSLPGRGGVVRVRDTASGELAPAAAGHQATIYACGITPYDATHIGHAATFLAWDLLVRAWRDAGHDVRYVQNVTDVDDPLLERAHRDGDDWRELAGREIARYRSDMESLRVLPPTRLVGAVEAMPLIERFALALADRGALYELEGDQYFSRTTDPAFGSVSRLDLATMVALSAERGGDPGRAGKKDPLDPLVWLAARPGEPSWGSAFGAGRPGWHVECAAIATEYLGDRFDVQAGGTDLIFPHHEMSASHARVALGDGGAAPAAFARCYAHAGMVRLAGEKMSKSQGNLVFVSSLLAGGADPMAVRLAILAHSYRDDWDWTEPGLAAAADRLARWRAAVSRCLAAPGGGVEPDPGPTGPGPTGPVPSGPVPSGPVPSGESVLAGVRERLADDLDAVGALAVIDRWAGAVASAASLPADAAAAAALVRDTADALLGIAL